MSRVYEIVEICQKYRLTRWITEKGKVLQCNLECEPFGRTRTLDPCVKVSLEDLQGANYSCGNLHWLTRNLITGDYIKRIRSVREAEYRFNFREPKPKGKTRTQVTVNPQILLECRS